MTREELLEKRREGFESSMKIPDGVEWDASISKYVGLNFWLADALFESWNAALDSVEIELPDTCNCCYDAEDTLDAVTICIESAGLKVKS